MMLSLAEILAVLAVSVSVLLSIAFFTVRSGKSLHPVYCPHCWAHEDKETVVTLAEQPNRWAICTDCIEHYWRFSDSDASCLVEGDDR